MFLACDIGNTNTKFGLFSDNILKDFLIIPNNQLDFNLLKEKSISKAAISSVVPAITNQLNSFIKEYFTLSSFIITKDSLFNLSIEYETPETLGIDRICSAEGAFALYKNNILKNNNYKNNFILSVDFGTATTINVISNDKRFIGGIIAPGVGTMFASLHKGTAQLPLVSIDNFKNVIGTSTITSIASGVTNAQTGLIEKMILHLENHYSAKQIHLYITGGNAKKIVPYIINPFTYVDELVLLGVKSIYERNISG